MSKKKPEVKKKRQVLCTALPWTEQEPDGWPGPRVHNPEVDVIQLGLQRLWQVSLRKLDGEEPGDTYLVVAGNSNVIHRTIPAGWEIEKLEDCGYCNVIIPRSV